MNHAESKNPRLENNDILFECGQCGKSLAIDCRGAGLNIRCPQCDRELEVPIPDGFDLAELDKEISASVASDKDLKAATAPLDTAAVSVDMAGQVEMLKAELAALRAQQPQPSSTYQNADIFKAIQAVQEQIGGLRKALDELSVLFPAPPGPTAEP